MAAACVLSTTDALPRRNPFRSSKKRVGSREALDLLRKCADFRQLKRIHAKIIREGLAHDQTLINNLLRMCSSYGKMDYAASVFSQMQSPATFTWNTMIRGYVLVGDSRRAFLLYTTMIRRGVQLDKFTFPFVIKACSASSAIRAGQEVHVLVIKFGLSGDMFVQHTLMDLYLKCGDSQDGRKVFDKMRVRNVVSWTTMLSGLIARRDLDAARALFEEMPLRNVVSWTAMIHGCARNGQTQEAFELFRRMQVGRVRPNEFTLVGLLMACTEVGSLKLGRWIHDCAMENGFEIGPHLGTALIDMYSKCGRLDMARKVFDEMRERRVATWNSMITGLGVHGRGEEALELFGGMVAEGMRPDAVTFVGVLCACVRAGMVAQGVEHFKQMQESYGIEPLPEHYACLAELGTIPVLAMVTEVP